MKMRKFKKGFTLVELVVVIAVIAILAAVSVGAYFGVTDSANSSAAEQYKKQIKDLWVMFSVSSEYTYGTTEEVAHNNAELFCMSYAVENGPQNIYVNYKVINIDSNSSLNNQNGAFDSYAIMFLIVSDYKTYFVTHGESIISESELLKSENDFKNSMNNGVESTSFISDSDREIFRTLGYSAFELSNVGTNDEIVLGYQYYEVNISGEIGNKPGTVYVKTNSTLAKDSEFKYANTEIKLQPNSQLFGKEYLLTYNDNTEVDPSIPFTKDNLTSECEPTPIVDMDNAFKVGTIEIKCDQLVDGSTLNMYNYPLCVITEDSSSVTFFKRFEDLTQYIVGFNDTSVINYLFVGNITLESDFTVPANYCMVLESTVSNDQNADTASVLDAMKSFVSLSYHKDSNYKYPNNDKNKGRCIQNQENVQYVSTTTYSNNTFTIAENVTLKLEGFLFNEGIFNVAAGGNDGVRVTNASTIIMEKDSLIEIGSKGILRSIGDINGEGKIITTAGAKVIEPFKITMFSGGTMTSEHHNKKIFPFYDYQFNSIKVDTHIVKGSSYSSFLGFHVSEKKGSIFGFEVVLVEEGIYLSDIDLVGTTSALFNFNSSGEKIIKSFKNNKTVLDMHGEIVDQPLTLNVNFAGYNYSLKSTEFNFPISNMIININEGAKLSLSASEGTGSRAKYAKYEILPNSELNVKGELVISNNVSVVIMNKKTYNDLGATFYLTTSLFNKFQENSSNRILNKYPDAKITGNIYGFVNEEEKNINDILLPSFSVDTSKLCSHSPKYVTVASSDNRSIEEVGTITPYLIVF